MNRQELWQQLQQNNQVSVLIIGAGINGIGTFRDLALQGVDVLLIDRGDFCSGASSASSHMVHGGIRYLENGEFRLVREAVEERNRLIQNAPHYVTPLPTTIPIFRWFSGLFNAPLKFIGLLDKPSERGAIVIKLGLMMYDAYTGRERTVPRHTFLLKKQALQAYPALNPEVMGVATYYDAAMPSPERIALEVMLDGVQEHPAARALNYASAVGAEGDKVVIRDELTGQTVKIQPQLVINAAGPWIDFVNQAMGQKSRLIGGTKGSHLVLNHPELYAAVKNNEFFFENHDGRIVLIYPLLGRVIVGTSDIKVDDPDSVRCTAEEEQYFLELVKRVFPNIVVQKKDIVFRFSGVRPLPSSESSTTGQISRDHSNQIVPPADGRPFPIFNLVGGKWTTFRAFAEHVTDQALQHLGRTRRGHTRQLPIGGGRDYPAEAQAWVQKVAQSSGVPAERVQILFKRYGTGAEKIAHFISAHSDQPLQHQPDYSQQEINYLVKNEQVVHLDDILLRRTLLGMMGLLTHGLVVEIAQIAAGALGWTAAEKEQEISRTFRLLAEYHGLNLTQPKLE